MTARPLRTWTTGAAFAVALCGALPYGADAQAPVLCRRTTAYAAAELLDALASGAPAAAVARLVTSCGTAFSLTGELEAKFRAAGADDALLGAMRKMSPPVGASPGARWTSPVDGAEMVLVPAGGFQMGSPATQADRDDDEVEHTQVIAAAFWVDVSEVTYAAYRRFVTAVPAWQKGVPPSDLADSNYLLDWAGTNFPAGRDNEPVRWVSWHAVRAYAAWAGKRLPSEAEWEYVARSGTTGRYWWGASFDASRVRGAGGGDLRSRQSPWGVIDALGGVWEWTSSLYRAYPYDSVLGEGDGPGRRVIRGGALGSGERFVRVANRSAEVPALTNELIGFRCVR